MNEHRDELLAVFSDALLGIITPNIRAICVRYTDITVHFSVFYDGNIDGADRERMAIVESEVAAGYPPPHTITHTVVRLDYPAPIPRDFDVWVFHRYEAPEFIVLK